MILSVSKGMVKTALGAIGYVISESGKPALTPILCFHASPRCSDEFLEILPLLAATGRRVVALDVPGYGMSENPPRSCSIDDIADAFLEVADSLGIEKFATIGNLMGNFPAVSLASRYPDRVAACIHANLYYYPPSSVKEKARTHDGTSKGDGTPIPESFELKDDGSHLVELHNKRKWLNPELNFRVVQGEITYLVNRRARYAKGISIEDLSEYDFEPPAKKTACPTLCIGGESALGFFDAIGFGGTQQFEAGCRLFSNCEVASLSGPKSTINMINQAPEDFTALCTDFLEKNNL
jgi:pimeloyl-ACP methyl ester carboxylesterase